MNSNSSFSNQDSILAHSLDISPDIYKIPLSKQVTSKDNSKCQTKSIIEPKSIELEKNTSISNIMNSKDKVKCPCCDSEKSKLLNQNPIFVEKREGSDPIFLDESEVQPSDEYQLEPSQKTKEELEQNEDIVSSQILKLIQQDNFDPSKFVI